jgi:hypothetical protein
VAAIPAPGHVTAITGPPASTRTSPAATADNVPVGELSTVDDAVAREGSAVDVSNDSDRDDDAGLIACETAPTSTAATPAPATAQTILRLMIDYP